MKKKELTPKQKETLAAIIRLGKRGYPATLNELCVEMQVKSTNAVRTHLAELQEKGYIHRAFNIARGIKVLKTA